MWQLVPDLFHLDAPKQDDVDITHKMFESLPKSVPHTDEDGEQLLYSPLLRLRLKGNYGDRNVVTNVLHFAEPTNNWQDLGFWHIGRSQVMTGKYGLEEYWHNDMANTLRTNHLDITLQPMFSNTPLFAADSHRVGVVMRVGTKLAKPLKETLEEKWTAKLSLEKMLFSAAARDDDDDGGDARKCRERPGISMRLSVWATAGWGLTWTAPSQNGSRQVPLQLLLKRRPGSVGLAGAICC